MTNREAIINILLDQLEERGIEFKRHSFNDKPDVQKALDIMCLLPMGYCCAKDTDEMTCGECCEKFLDRQFNEDADWLAYKMILEEAEL